MLLGASGVVVVAAPTVKVVSSSVTVLPLSVVPVMVRLYFPAESALNFRFSSSFHRSNHLALIPLRLAKVGTIPVAVLVTTALMVLIFWVQVTMPRRGKEELPWVRLWTMLLPASSFSTFWG